MGKILSPLLPATLLALALALAACAGPDAYGAKLSGAPAATIADVLGKPVSFGEKALRVTGKVDRQCPSSGCWFDLRDGDGPPLRVTLEHLGLTIPQRVGATATVEGKIFKGASRVELVGDGVEFKR